MTNAEFKEEKLLEMLQVLVEKYRDKTAILSANYPDAKRWRKNSIAASELLNAIEFLLENDDD